MIAKLPKLPSSPASRADQAISSAGNQPKSTGHATFEHALSHRQRVARQREDAVALPTTDKTAEPRQDRAQGKDVKPREKADAPAARDDASIDRPADVPRDRIAKQDATEPAIAVEPSASAVEETAEAAQPSEGEAVGEQQAAVESVALELVQQVAQSMVAPQETATQSVATTGQPAAASVQTTLKKNENASPVITGAGIAMSIEGDAQGEADGSAVATQPGTAVIHAEESPAHFRVAAMSSSDALIEPGAAPIQLSKHVTSNGETASLSSINGSAAAPALVPAGEAFSAQLAQLPQGDEEAVRDQINMGRLTRGLNSAINQRGGSVTLRLTPPELGLVRIDMAVREGVVNAKFTAQSESVRNLLMDQMGQLRQALDRQGLSVDKIEVQITQQASDSGFGQQRDDMGRDGRSAGQYHSSRQGRGNPSDLGASRRTESDTFDRALADMHQ